MATNGDIIRWCNINLSNAIEKYQDNWISDKTWVRVISARYPDVINTIGFSRATFNRAISRHASQCGTQNDMGIFIQQFSTSCHNYALTYWELAKEFGLSLLSCWLWHRLYFTICKAGGRFWFRTCSWKRSPQEEKGKEKDDTITISIKRLPWIVYCCVLRCHR